MSCCCFVITKQGTVNLIERFGAFNNIARPGLTCLVPCCDCVGGTVSMRLTQLEVACETKTKDNVFVTIKVAVQYQVKSDDTAIQAAHYRLTNPKGQVSPAPPRTIVPCALVPPPLASALAAALPPCLALMVVSTTSPLQTDRVVRLRRCPLVRAQD